MYIELLKPISIPKTVEILFINSYSKQNLNTVTKPFCHLIFVSGAARTVTGNIYYASDLLVCSF